MHEQIVSGTFCPYCTERVILTPGTDANSPKPLLHPDKLLAINTLYQIQQYYVSDILREKKH